MTDQQAVRVVTIVNPQGLHARPADMFVKLAAQFASQIEVVKDNERIDGKSILAVLTLAAAEGTLLQLEARGPDAEAALAALAQLIAQGFNEMETSES